METIKKLNWIYYGQMVLALLALTVIYYASSKNLFEPLDIFSDLGKTVQYVLICDALLTIPLGLYLIKWRKPQTLEKYQTLAAARILLVSNAMPLGILAYFWLADEKGFYMSMFWVAAIAAIAWFFSKPTLAKVDKEMTPEDPNMPTY